MSKEVAKSAAQMRKGVLDLCILRILSGGEAYTSDIIDALQAVDLLVVEGTVYPLLTRMKNSGALDYRWEESTSGPPRKYYRITPASKSMLPELESTSEAFVHSVNSINAEPKKS